MSFQALSERLTALQETTKQVEELIARLANIKFQPGSVPLDLDDEEENVTTELSNEIHQTLKEQGEDLELLEQEVQDLTPGRAGSQKSKNKATLGDWVKRVEQESKLVRSAFRKAQLTAKASLALAQREERALLLSSMTNPSSSTESLPPRRKPLASSQELSKEDKEKSAASDVTAALRRTHAMMASELSRSQFAHDTLKESTLALKELGETYSVLDTMLSKSRTLVGTLLKSNKSDTWYLESAFYLLAVTIAWLVFRRFIYGPAWWLVWLPLKMFYKAWMGVFVAVGLRESRDGVFVEKGFEGPSMSVQVMGKVSPSVTGSEAPGVRVAENDVAVEEGMIEEVGRIIDDSHGSDGDYNGEEAESGTKNPRKRMWEEELVVREDQKVKDEL